MSRNVRVIGWNGSTMPCLIPGCTASEASDGALVPAGAPLFAVLGPASMSASRAEGPEEALVSACPPLFAVLTPASRSTS